MTTTMNKKQATSKLLTIIADLYKVPDESLWEDFSNGLLMDELMECVLVACGNNGLYSINNFPDEYEQWKRLYFETFGGGANKPIESLYKPWTMDNTCGMPFARSKGFLLGDSAMHIRFLLQKFEMEIPEDYMNTPDHLVILLELLAYFIENAPVEFTYQFMEEHFDWLPEFESNLKMLPNSNFYLQITGVLLEVIQLIKTRNLLN